MGESGECSKYFMKKMKFGGEWGCGESSIPILKKVF